MLLYSNGRMSCGNISFPLPEGFFYSGIAEDSVYENMICFYGNHNGGDIRIDLCIHPTDSSAKDYTDDWFKEEMEYLYLTPVSPITRGGLHGYHAMYDSGIEDRNTQHYACFLENDLQGEEHYILELVIECKHIEIQEVMQMTEIQDLLSSIKGELVNV